MKNETNITHRRYYIYRHKMVDAETQVVQYLNGDDWTNKFEHAYLLADHEHTVWMAQNRKKYFHPDAGFTVCIGAVDVTVAGQFVLEIVE